MNLPTIKTSIQIRYSDLDTLGHVSNVVYNTYLDFARVQWFLSVPGEIIPSVLVNININFSGEIKFGDDVQVVTRCTKVGNKSIRLSQTIFANQNLVTTSESTLVGFDPDARTSVPLLKGWGPSIDDVETGSD